MAKTPRAALTRLATTVTARFYPSSGATDGFYLDGRISGRREHRAADITLDREERGFFYAAFAHLSSAGQDEAAMGIVRKSLDRIGNEVRQVGRNIDTEINELAECAVSVAGRITLQHDGVRQPYFAGIIVKDSELAAVTMGNGCAYLYRNDILYPLTADDFPIEAIDHSGKQVTGLDVYCAGVAGTVRYSNIAQLQMDDCVLVCNKEVMDALGQREILRMLYEAEDQADAAGLIITAASAKLPGVPLQCLISFVESITTADRTARLNLGRVQTETAATQPAVSQSGRSSSGPGVLAAAPKAEKRPILPDDEDTSDYPPVQAGGRQTATAKTHAESRNTQNDAFEEEEYSGEAESTGRGRRIAFYVVIALVCIGSLFAIYNMLFSNKNKTEATTTAAVQTTVTTTVQPTSQTTTASSAATTESSATTVATTTTAPSGQVQHVVVAGDSLWGLSKKYYGAGTQTNIDRIKEANNLTSDTLYIGQVLIIPPKP
jgi:nucleoid-associated protein YgaU